MSHLTVLALSALTVLGCLLLILEGVGVTSFTARAFPFGKAAFSVLILAVVSGSWIMVQPPPNHNATITYWCFATPHYNAYKAAIPIFEQEHPGVTVDLEQVSNTALAARLEASMLANVDVPDCCELEISQAGTMFRGPIKDVGFINL